MAVAQEPLRVAFFHSELSRDGPGLMLRDILSGEDEQVLAIVAVVRAVDPDVLVLGGVDWDLQGHGLAALAEAFGGFPHRFAARPNRGVDSGLDLNGDGQLGTPDDAFGYAEFAGQEGSAVLSRLPLDLESIQNFSGLLWRDLPDAIPPEGAAGQGRLSTTAHWVVPVLLRDGTSLSLLIWHATPPVFDGPEDRNGRRNHDEAAFWSQYLDGNFGSPPARFVLLGAANLDTLDGDGRPGALRQILSDPRLSDPRPASIGAVDASRRDGGVNLRHRADPRFDTVDWPDDAGRPGNMRVDYVLPSATLDVRGAGVFWPTREPRLGAEVEVASRHRLVWIDIAVPGG